MHAAVAASAREGSSTRHCGGARRISQRLCGVAAAHGRGGLRMDARGSSRRR
jgi:hypothetical protein